MRRSHLPLAAVSLLGQSGGTPRFPQSVDEVARLGGRLAGSPKIALVKVADGFYDPTNVANAGDATGRIFVTRDTAKAIMRIEQPCYHQAPRRFDLRKDTKGDHNAK
jgi:hypothetical protein